MYVLYNTYPCQIMHLPCINYFKEEVNKEDYIIHNLKDYRIKPIGPCSAPIKNDRDINTLS